MVAGLRRASSCFSRRLDCCPYLTRYRSSSERGVRAWFMVLVWRDVRVACVGMVVVMRGLMRGRVLAGFVAVAVLVPSVVLATHTFADVPDGTYYTAAVEWAGDNGITTGTSATTFSPDDSVTRAQNVTFAYRYDQNVVQPARDGIDTAIDANTTAADTA